MQLLRLSNKILPVSTSSLTLPQISKSQRHGWTIDLRKTIDLSARHIKTLLIRLLRSTKSQIKTMLMTRSRLSNSSNLRIRTVWKKVTMPMRTRLLRGSTSACSTKSVGATKTARRRKMTSLLHRVALPDRVDLVALGLMAGSVALDQPGKPLGPTTTVAEKTMKTAVETMKSTSRTTKWTKMAVWRWEMAPVRRAAPRRRTHLLMIMTSIVAKRSKKSSINCSVRQVLISSLTKEWLLRFRLTFS